MRFESTDWSQLVRASHRHELDGQAAFGQVLSRYRPTMIGYICANFRLERIEAEELVQQFILDRFIEKDLLAHVDRTRGKFRSFLATTLGNYVRDVLRREGRRSSCGGVTHLNDGAIASDVDPFDQAWAESTLAEALALTARELRGKDKEVYWNLFHARVVQQAYNEADPEEFPALAQRLGFTSPRDASNAMVTAKRTFERALLSLVEPEDYPDAHVLADELLKIVRRRATGRGY